MTESSNTYIASGVVVTTNEGKTNLIPVLNDIDGLGVSILIINTTTTTYKDSGFLPPTKR